MAGDVGRGTKGHSGQSAPGTGPGSRRARSDRPGTGRALGGVGAWGVKIAALGLFDALVLRFIITVN